AHRTHHPRTAGASKEDTQRSSRFNTTPTIERSSWSILNSERFSKTPRSTISQSRLCSRKLPAKTFFPSVRYPSLTHEKVLTMRHSANHKQETRDRIVGAASRR